MSDTELMDGAIRSILLQKWDPLGVGGNPNLRDEYDEFIDEIRCELRLEKSTLELCTLLMKFDRELGADELDFNMNYSVAVELLALAESGYK